MKLIDFFSFVFLLHQTGFIVVLVGDNYKHMGVPFFGRFSTRQASKKFFNPLNFFLHSYVHYNFSNILKVATKLIDLSLKHDKN